MSFIPVLEYLAGLTVFGFVYWLMDGIMDNLRASGIGEGGSVYDLLFFLWAGILVVYMIFGGWWLVRKYNEREPFGRM